MKILVLVAAALTTTVASLGAQAAVTVRCTPTDGSAAGCYYCPGFEHVIKWVGIQMHSASVNLLAYHDQDVVITGTWNGSVIEVASVALDTESFSISGNGSVGNHFDFDTTGPSGGLAVNFAALGNAFFVPFGDIAVQIDPNSAFVLSGGALGTAGQFKSRLDLPDDASLIGLRVYGQGLVVTPVGDFYTTNVDTKVIG